VLAKREVRPKDLGLAAWRGIRGAHLSGKAEERRVVPLKAQVT